VPTFRPIDESCWLQMRAPHCRLRFERPISSAMWSIGTSGHGQRGSKGMPQIFGTCVARYCRLGASLCTAVKTSGSRSDRLKRITPCKNSRHTAFACWSLFLIRPLLILSYRFLSTWHRGCGQISGVPRNRGERSKTWRPARNPSLSTPNPRRTVSRHGAGHSSQMRLPWPG
jgi:hypothetical protein